MTQPFYDVKVVIFDCDSTLSAVEGIDELAARKGVDEQLAPLTTAAMEGRMKLEEIYGHRLALIRPARRDIDWLIQRYIASVVTDAGYVIKNLQESGKEVHIVSGGIRQAVS
ncbi:MAG TPA: haloacid dehalogenase, partial [Gammaproteobacteria bacterium]|nr:haloacid dehalogenase [Gammaproteobacteria bacterium]